MKAHTGDRIVVEGNQVGSPRREGEIVEVLGGASDPPYRVHWDHGEETVFFPGTDARIEPRGDAGA